jgi:hypothetical protein
MPEFNITINIMRESRRETFWVVINRTDRPTNCMPWDHKESRMTPFMSETLEHACIEAFTWARFLQCEVDISQVKDRPEYPTEILIL